MLQARAQRIPLRLSSRQLTTVTTSSANSSLRREQQAQRNPYRPELPPLETKQPRKAIVKNLKFGRIAEAASAATETAKAVLADSAQAVTDAAAAASVTSASSSSSSPTSSKPRSGLSQSQRTEYEGNSNNARYNPNGKRGNAAGGPLASSAFWLVAAAAAGAGVYLYVSPSAPGGETAIKARELAASNDVRSWLCLSKLSICIKCERANQILDISVM